jgi:hypothetical protein
MDRVTYLPDVKHPSAVLWYVANACPADFNKRVLEFVRDIAMRDPFFKKAKQVHRTRQAGAMCYGEEFVYRKEHWHKSTMPPVFAELLVIAQGLTGEAFDTVLFKVYAPGERYPPFLLTAHTSAF